MATPNYGYEKRQKELAKKKKKEEKLKEKHERKVHGAGDQDAPADEQTPADPGATPAAGGN